MYTTLYKDMSSIALQQHHSKHFAHREECDKNIQQISIANNQSKGPPKVRSWPAALPRNANLFDPGGYHSSLVAHDQHCCLPLYIHSFTAASSCYSATANDVAGQILFLIDTCGLVFFQFCGWIHQKIHLNAMCFWRSSFDSLECCVLNTLLFYVVLVLTVEKNVWCLKRNGFSFPTTYYVHCTYLYNICVYAIQIKILKQMWEFPHLK